MPTVRIGSRITIHSRRRADLAVSAMETNAPSSAGGVYLTVLSTRPPHWSLHRVSTRSPVDQCRSTHLSIRGHLRVHPADHFRTVFLLLLGRFANLAHSGRTGQGPTSANPLERKASTAAPRMSCRPCDEGVSRPLAVCCVRLELSTGGSSEKHLARLVASTTRRLRVTCRAAIPGGTSLGERFTPEAGRIAREVPTGA